MIENTRKYKIEAFILGVNFYFFTLPFFAWNSTFILLSNVCIAFCIMLLHLNLRSPNTKILLIFWILITSIIGYGRFYNIFGLIPLFMQIPIPFINRRFLKVVYKNFLNIFAVMMALSIVVYILVIVGVAVPHHTIDAVNAGKDYNYEAYPFLVIPNKMFPLFRFHALFDEPGVVGTYAVLLLGINGFNLKKWQNVVILLSGILSLSLFFYVGIFILLSAILFLYKSKAIYKILYVSFIAVSIVLMNDDSTIIGEAIGARLEYDETKGSVSGDNRATEVLDAYYEKKSWTTPVFYFGARAVNLEKKTVDSILEGSASYKNAILLYGFFGSCMYILFFLLLCRERHLDLKSVILFLIGMLIVLGQRPFVYDKSFIFLFCVWVSMSTFNRYENKMISVPKVCKEI